MVELRDMIDTIKLDNMFFFNKIIWPKQNNQSVLTRIWTKFTEQIEILSEKENYSDLFYFLNWNEIYR